MTDQEVAQDTGDLATLLARHPFFQALTCDEIEVLTRPLPRIDFAPSTVFVHEGEPGDCGYLLVSGSVEILKALGTADERSFGVRGPGEFIGEMSLIDPDERRSASVRAQGAVTALVVTRQDFDALLAHSPQLSLHLLRLLSQRLRNSENATIRDLQAKNQALRQAYLDLQIAQEKLVEQEVLARELAHAQRIQLQMLPAVLPHIAGAEIGAVIRAARSVGGDFYDVIRLDDDRLALVIGDVAGKGIPAALYMALASSLVRAEAAQSADPETVVRRVNQHLVERDMESMFVTLLYAEVNLRTRVLRLVRAGHEHPLLWENGRLVMLQDGQRSMPLGLVATPLLDVRTVKLPAASTLLMVTDGVADAIDAHTHPFGKVRLLELAAGNLHLSAQALCEAIAGAVLAHQGAMPQFDDVTSLVFRLH